jgi:hypothetical protein
MTELRRQLIMLYAQGRIDEVHNRADYQQLCLAHEGDRAFDGERCKIEELRFKVEEFLAHRDSYKGQVEFGLRLLWQLRTAEERESKVKTPEDQKHVAS